MKSGTVDRIEDVPELIERIFRAVEKRLYVDRQQLDSILAGNLSYAQQTYIDKCTRERKASIAKHESLQLRVVRIAVEGVDDVIHTLGGAVGSNP